MISQQWSEPSADSEVDARLLILSVRPVHVVAILVGHHLQGQLVVVAEEDRPLAVLGNRRGLGHDVDDRKPVLLRQRHVHARHDRKVEGHLAFVAVAKVRQRVLRPLIRFGQQHAAGVFLVDAFAQELEKDVGLGKVLARRPFALVEVRHSVESEGVDP